MVDGASVSKKIGDVLRLLPRLSVLLFDVRFGVGFGVGFVRRLDVVRFFMGVGVVGIFFFFDATVFIAVLVLSFLLP